MENKACEKFAIKRISSILLEETNWGEHKIDSICEYPTIIILHGDTTDCRSRVVIPALEEFEKESKLSVSVFDLDSTAQNYDDYIKETNQRFKSVEVKDKNIIVMYDVTRVMELSGPKKFQNNINGLLRTGISINDEKDWTGWHLIVVVNKDVTDWWSNSHWGYFSMKGCLRDFEI